MAFYTNPGWSNLTPPPVSEQNLNDMSNALEKAVYVENGKLYDNNNNLVDTGNAKITLGSYVGSGTNRITIQIPENQLLFIMLSQTDHELGDFTRIVLGSDSVPLYYGGIQYSYGFVEQLYSTIPQGIQKLGYFQSSNSRYAVITRISDGQDGQLSFSIGGNANTYIYNLSGVTYHYATIGV